QSRARGFCPCRSSARRPAPIWNQLTGVLPFRSVWTLMPSNSAAFPIFTRGMSTAVTPIFRWGVTNLSPSTFAPRLEYRVSRRGRGDEKASGDRVFCHFIDGRGVLRRRLSADGTAALSIGPSHGRRLDGHLFWRQRRLRLGAGLIKYRFCRCSDKYPFAERIGNSGRRDDATWHRRDRARWYEPVEFKQSARRHC